MVVLHSHTAAFTLAALALAALTGALSAFAYRVTTFRTWQKSDKIYAQAAHRADSDTRLLMLSGLIEDNQFNRAIVDRKGRLLRMANLAFVGLVVVCLVGFVTTP